MLLFNFHSMHLINFKLSKTESLQFTYWVIKGLSFLPADSEDSD